jgi:hypothetical protein
MRNYLLQFSFITLAIFSISINAKVISKQDVPEKVFSFIYKKYPKAEAITIEEKTHFGRSLYEVKFKVSQTDNNNKIYNEEFIELFKTNGHFYINVIAVERPSFSMITSDIKKNLQLYYPDYKILAMNLVINPYGVGEEYEMNLLVSGEIWNISIDDKGKLISETRQEKR